MDFDAVSLKLPSLTPLQLTILNYEIAIDFMKKSQIFDNSFHKYILKSQKSVNLLYQTLDLNIEIGRSLASIYLFVEKQLIEALLSNNSASITDCISIFEILLSSWKTIELDDPRQSIFIGMTYKNGEISEYITETSNNEFKA